MTPTYTTIEILEILNRLDLEELAILGEIVTEEFERYKVKEISIIHANFSRRVQRLAKDQAEKVMSKIWRT